MTTVEKAMNYFGLQTPAFSRSAGLDGLKQSLPGEQGSQTCVLHVVLMQMSFGSEVGSTPGMNKLSVAWVLFVVHHS